MEGRFVEVPPPAMAPVQQQAIELGLCRGLKVEESRYGQWRCNCCRKMQPSGALQVWVPDSVMKGDPAWSVTEAARQNAYNGHLSAWCVKCAPKAEKKPPENAAPSTLRLWLARLLRP